jgi:hypothetical protein
MVIIFSPESNPSNGFPMPLKEKKTILTDKTHETHFPTRELQISNLVSLGTLCGSA